MTKMIFVFSFLLSLVASFLVLGNTAAHGTPKTQTYKTQKNTYLVYDLPTIIATETIFEVQPKLPKKKVCSISYGKEVQTKYYDFLISPSIIASHGKTVTVKLCNGRTNTFTLRVRPAYTINTTQVPNTGQLETVLFTNNTNETMNVIVAPLHEPETTLQYSVGPKQQSPISIPTGKSKEYTFDSVNLLTFTTPSGLNGSVLVEAGNGWTVLEEERKHFSPCDTVTWKYVPDNSPSRNIQEDINAAFNLLAHETSLVFVETAENNPDITFRWADFNDYGNSHAAATANLTYSTIFFNNKISQQETITNMLR